MCHVSRVMLGVAGDGGEGEGVRVAEGAVCLGGELRLQPLGRERDHRPAPRPRQRLHGVRLLRTRHPAGQWQYLVLWL